MVCPACTKDTKMRRRRDARKKECWAHRRRRRYRLLPFFRRRYYAKPKPKPTPKPRTALPRSPPRARAAIALGSKKLRPGMVVELKQASGKNFKIQQHSHTKFTVYHTGKYIAFERSSKGCHSPCKARGIPDSAKMTVVDVGKGMVQLRHKSSGSYCSIVKRAFHCTTGSQTQAEKFTVACMSGCKKAEEAEEMSLMEAREETAEKSPMEWLVPDK